MTLFQVIMVVCITGLCFMTSLFLVLRTIPYINPGINWWIASCGGLSFSYIIAYFKFDQAFAVSDQIGFYTLSMVVVLLAYIGFFKFLSYKISVKKSFIYCFVGLGLVLFSSLVLKNTLLADLIFSAINSSFLMMSALIFFKKKGEFKRLHMLVGACLATLSLHYLDYPWLHDVEWFAAIGFFLALILNITMWSMLSLILLLQFKSRALQSEEHAVYISMHDQLTGLHNRFALEQYYRDFVAENTESKQGLSILYLDLDGFKQVNDTYGHEAGDVVLQVISQRITSNLKGVDYVARLGGDEFIVLYKHLSKDTAENLANLKKLPSRLLKEIEKPIQHKQSSYNVSSSIGVSHYPHEGETLDELMKVADHKMYDQKSRRKLAAKKVKPGKRTSQTLQLSY